MNDQKLDALLEAVAENTTTLIDVQQQAAATSASSKDARNYIQTVARQTSWETNGKVIASVLTAALEKITPRAARCLKGGTGNARAVGRADPQDGSRGRRPSQEASNKFHFAAERLLRVAEAHEQGSGAEWAGWPS
ncbi:hypothetical protein GLP59_15365 [Sulfitobacter sp. M220]|uniref:hypothetical protein n=1 Tax=Sulfitobacter sp. M220 TaxID=2675333 RepID=UPI001F1684D6|nr:hypothetical protein [Sulfitobacter sp. M220]MCF7779004.1 hypothetical protein [Sulfitobacter sp. M220]